MLFSSLCLVDGIDLLLNLQSECIQLLLLILVCVGCHCVCLRVCAHNVEGLCEPHGFPYFFTSKAVLL